MQQTITIKSTGHTVAPAMLAKCKRVFNLLASQRAAFWLMAVAAAAIYVALLLDDTRLLAWATIGGTAAMLRYITPMTKGGEA